MTKLSVSDGLAGNDVKVFEEARDGALWIGTYGGLSRIKDGLLTSYKKSDGLASDRIRSVYEDPDGVLWIGSYDWGLTRFKHGQFTRYTSTDGLLNDGVFQILEDSSANLWMSCNRGIYRVGKRQLDDFAEGRISHIDSIAYSKADGLSETECNGGQQPAGIKTSNGELWFPTQGGVAVIRPAAIIANPLPPPVIIETVKIDNEATALENTIRMTPGKNDLEISYTGLSFIKSELVKFRYKLVGQDADWIEARDRRTAYYSYLPPGEYTFQVIAANSDGVWNIQGATIKVVVQPPYYRTQWFWAIVLSIFVGLTCLSYRLRINGLE
jgi:hypothetical protein